MPSKNKSLYWKIIRILRFVKRNFILLLLTGALALIIYNYLYPKRKVKSIDYVSVAVLSKEEEKALKKYPNEYHVEIGQKLGLKTPIKSKQEFDKNFSEYDLKEVKDCKYYNVPILIHSLPYLKNNAIKFINDLGKRFSKSLEEKEIRNYRFTVTSVLRTTNGQIGLRKSNVNATPNNSSHYYGLSFDLSQTMFYESGKKDPIYSYRLRNLLLRELIKMQEEGKCYVLLENQTKCIHITVTE